jgi:hypothetical protein
LWGGIADEEWAPSAPFLENILLRQAVQRVIPESIGLDSIRDLLRAQGRDLEDLDLHPKATSALSAFRQLEVSIEMEYALLVAQARLEGESWSAIGLALGLSKQAVQQRFGTVAAELAPFFTEERQAHGNTFNRDVFAVLDRHHPGKRSVGIDGDLPDDN